MLDYTPYPHVLECFNGIGRGGVVHIVRLASCLTPLIKREPYESKPIFDLKLPLNEQRALFENEFKDDPLSMIQASETCDKLEGMFLQRWKSKCEEMGWYNFDVI